MERRLFRSSAWGSLQLVQQAKTKMALHADRWCYAPGLGSECYRHNTGLQSTKVTSSHLPEGTPRHSPSGLHISILCSQQGARDALPTQQVTASLASAA